MTDTTTPDTAAPQVQFSDLKLDPKVLQAIADAGYTTPTPIQAGAIPPALEGRDVLGIAQTGTGKTASFTLPMITLLGRGRARARMPRSLVLCPTRELAAQVAENFDTYAKHTRLTKALLIGGVSMKDQERLIASGVDVLIATPGRLLDHFERGNLLLQGVQVMVVDEADRMLDMGFIPDIERIFQLTPFTRQTLFFSATMAPEIERITDTFLHNPARIEVARQATASETITQRLVQIVPTRKDQAARQKRQLLRALIDAEGAALKNAIIFCNRKTEVDVVAKSLKTYGYDAAPIHGDLDQSQRMRTLDGFREGTLRFLIASDVAARGLDIPAVSHVFNFDLPSHAEDYVHRIGRTGRAGREGTAISLGTPSDEKYLAAIENLIKRSLPRATPPEGFAVSESKGASEGRDEAKSEGGKPASSRSRSRRPRAEARPAAVLSEVLAEAPKAAAPQPEAPKAEAPRVDTPRASFRRDDAERAPEPREERRRDDRRDERRDGRRDERGEGRREDRADGRRDERGEGRRDERRDDRRDDRGERRGPSVLGFGDQTPDFMTRSFKTNLVPLTEAEIQADLEAAKADSARRAREDDSERRDGERQNGERRDGGERRERGGDDRRSAERSGDERGERRSRGGRGRSRDRVRADDAAVTEAIAEVATEATTDATPAPTDTATEAKAPAKPRRSRAKAKPEAAEGAAPETAGVTDAPAKPPRAPRKRAAKVDPVDEGQPAPKRATSRTRTRRKADTDAPADAGAAAVEAAPQPAGDADAGLRSGGDV